MCRQPLTSKWFDLQFLILCYCSPQLNSVLKTAVCGQVLFMLRPECSACDRAQTARVSSDILLCFVLEVRKSRLTGSSMRCVSVTLTGWRCCRSLSHGHRLRWWRQTRHNSECRWGNLTSETHSDPNISSKTKQGTLHEDNQETLPLRITLILTDDNESRFNTLNSHLKKKYNIWIKSVF